MGLGKIVTPIVTFLVTIYIVQKLSVEEWGIYSILIASMHYIGLFSSLGLPSIFQRFLPEFHTKKFITKINKLVLKGSLYRTGLAALFIVIIIVFSDLSGRLFKIDNWLAYFQLFSLAILFCLEAELLNAAMISLFQHKYFVISNTIYVLFRGGLLYYLLYQGKALKGLLLGEVAMYGVFMVLLIYFYNTRFARKSREIDDKSETDLPFKRLLKYGSFSYFNEMGVMILNVSTDYFIISAFLGPIAVGIYSFANKVNFLLSRLLPHSFLAEVIQPSFFTKYVNSGRKSSLEKMGNMLIKITAFFSLPLAVAIVILGDKVIIYLFDPKYMSSLHVLWIGAVFLTVRHFLTPLGLVLQSLEKVKYLFYSKIFAIYNLIFDIVAVQIWGIMGVAVVTCSAAFLQITYLYFACKKHTGIALSFKPLFAILGNSIPMAVIIYFLRDFITGKITFAIVVALGIIAYFVVSYLNKIFNKEERDAINAIIGKPLFRF
jgi:O-antigen/teichoic acid export membrane protein